MLFNSILNRPNPMPGEYKPTPTPGCIRPNSDGMFNLRHSYINNWDKEWPDI